MPPRTKLSYSVKAGRGGCGGGMGTPIPFSQVPQAPLDSFWSCNDISSRSRQQGLQYATEGYIHGIYFHRRDQKTVIEAKSYRSQRKHEKPHLICVETEGEMITCQCCSCTAGAPGYCSHVVGLMYTLDLWRAKNMEGEPEVSSTSVPQVWHKPRGNKVVPQPVPCVVTAKAKLERKKMPVVSALTDNRLIFEVTAADQELMKSMAEAPISYLANTPDVGIAVRDTIFPVGSALSYQMPLISVEQEDDNMCSAVDIPLALSPEIQTPPLQTNPNFTITYAKSIQQQTTNQQQSQLWHTERQGRITASKFGDVIKKKKNTPLFVESVYRPKSFSSVQTQYGNINEKVAREEYHKIFPDRHIHKCGLLLQPSLPFLGATPDGIICDGEQRGLLEIKCPYSVRDMTVMEAASTVKKFHLIKEGETMNISQTHNTYYQIQGQLLMSGLDFCDLVVYTQKDMFVTRVNRRNDFINDMIVQLFRFHNKHSGNI